MDGELVPSRSEILLRLENAAFPDLAVIEISMFAPWAV